MNENEEKEKRPQQSSLFDAHFENKETHQ